MGQEGHAQRRVKRSRSQSEAIGMDLSALSNSALTALKVLVKAAEKGELSAFARQ